MIDVPIRDFTASDWTPTRSGAQCLVCHAWRMPCESCQAKETKEVEVKTETAMERAFARVTMAA
jgi:hypothetical protein